MNPAPECATAAADPLDFLWARVGNVWGQHRRFYRGLFQPGYIRRQAALRKGDCNRCGLCCQLVFKCPSLRFENGLASCARYQNRPANCSHFPIDEADLDDVRRIAPHARCTFSFDVQRPACAPADAP
jgi:hypothetical protein